MRNTEGLSTVARRAAQNDILKEFVGRGTWVFPVEPSIKLVGDTILYCAEHAPWYSPVSVCGYHIRESGANLVQEMAYALCIAKAYIDRRELPETVMQRIRTLNDIIGMMGQHLAAV